jgi:hypothetical protein
MTIARSIASPIARSIGSSGAGGLPPLVNLITNGTFDTDTNWTKGFGFAITGGQCVRTPTSGGSLISQVFAITPGKTYLIQIDVIALSAPLTTRFMGGTTVFGGNITTTGSFETTIVAGAGNTTFAIGAGAAGITCTFDNVRVYKID